MITPEAINTMLTAEWGESGNKCLELSPTHAFAVSEPPETALRPGGYISGPTQFAIADAALWYLVFGALDRIEPMALTSELSIRFLRPAIGKKLYARATLNKAGRRSVVGTVVIWTDGNESRPSATAQGTYMLPHDSD